MSVYLDVVYLFNKFINETANEQAIKYHVGNFPGGNKSIVINKYNLIIDTILAISTKFDNVIEKAKSKFNTENIKCILPSNYDLSQPTNYKGWTWSNKRHKYIPLDLFIYYLGCDIKECLKAYDNTIEDLGNKLLKGFQCSEGIGTSQCSEGIGTSQCNDTIKLTKAEKNKITEFKLVNNDWETLIKNTPQDVDTELTNLFLDKKERKRLRTVYYNKDILERIYKSILEMKPHIDRHICKNKYTIPSKIVYYTKNIKYKLSFIQSRLTTNEIQTVFNYIMSHINLPFSDTIEKNATIISKKGYTNADTNIYYTYDNNEFVQRNSKPKLFTNTTNFNKNTITLLNVIESINADIPIIDIDPDRHLEIFLEYPQHVLYSDGITGSFIKDFNWKSLKQGINNDILPEYIQNVGIIIDRFNFKHIVLT